VERSKKAAQAGYNLNRDIALFLEIVACIQEFKTLKKF
jgi:hypothetical protein